MKPFIVIVLLAGVVLGLAATGVGYAQLLRARSETAKVQRELAGTWARVEGAVQADGARWRDDPLVAKHPGGDAGPLIFKHIGLQDGSSNVPKLFKPAGLWLEALDDVDTGKLDLEWMRELKTFGYWEIGGPGTPLEAVPVSIDEPLIAFVDLQTFGRARLVRGLQGGDAREAAAQVRELARLCLTTEHLVGAMVGVSLLTSEASAFEEASKRKQATAGWVPYSLEDAASLRRLVLASPAPFAVLATPPLSTTNLPVGGCVGLHEGLWQLNNFEGMRAAFATRYGELDQELARSTCRLPRMRKAWASAAHSEMPLQGGMQFLPFGNEILANEAALITALSWFRQYEAAADAK